MKFSAHRCFPAAVGYSFKLQCKDTMGRKGHFPVSERIGTNWNESERLGTNRNILEQIGTFPPKKKNLSYGFPMLFLCFFYASPMLPLWMCYRCAMDVLWMPCTMSCTEKTLHSDKTYTVIALHLGGFVPLELYSV